MRRLTGGLLAAALVVFAGCGTSATEETAPTPTMADSPVLAAAKSLDEPMPPQTGSFTILVVSPAGVDDPGLDAAVNTLLARPDTGVEVVTPATPDFATIDDRATSRLSLLDAETMTGYPAQIVNGTTADAVATALDGSRPLPDLVIVGISGDTPVGHATSESHAADIARMVAAHDVAVLVVASPGDDADLAGASVAMTTVLDYEMDRILEEGGPFVLTVPTCPSGMWRGPVVVDHVSRAVPESIDCTLYPDAEPNSDVEAFGAGFASLADIGRS